MTIRARWRRRIAVVAVALVAAVGVVNACAPLPAEKAPRAIDREKVPDLFPAPTTTAPVSGQSGLVCFVQPSGSENSGSACVEVSLEEISPRTLVDALAAGPGDKGPRANLTSYVPQDTRLLDAEEDPDNSRILIINLSSEINTLSSPNNIVAYQQIVETLTNDDNGLDVDAIRVKVDGKATKIPTDKGQLPTARPSDFNDSTTGSTTTTTVPK